MLSAATGMLSVHLNDVIWNWRFRHWSPVSARCAILTVDALASVPDSAVGRDELVTMRQEASTTTLARLAGLVKGASAVFPLTSSGEDLLAGIVLAAHLKAQ